MDEKIYKAIAKKHGISVDEVKKEMQAAIQTAYVFPAPEALKVPRKNDVPTVDEFLEYTAKKVVDGL